MWWWATEKSEHGAHETSPPACGTSTHRCCCNTLSLSSKSSTSVVQKKDISIHSQVKRKAKSSSFDSIQKSHHVFITRRRTSFHCKSLLEWNRADSSHAILTGRLKLLVSLRNAAATFGKGSAPYESIRASVEQHVQSMKAKGQPTNITQTRQPTESASEAPAALSFGSLALRPKPRAK